MSADLSLAFANAVYSGDQAIRINTDEAKDALVAIQAACAKNKWQLHVFDLKRGLVSPGDRARPGRAEEKKEAIGDVKTPTSLAPLLAFADTPPVVDPSGVRPVVTVFLNFHLTLNDPRYREHAAAAVYHIACDRAGDHPAAAQLVAQGLDPGADTGKFLVGLMPREAKLPAELRPLFKVVNHDLPDDAEVGKILDEMELPSGAARPDGEERRRAVVAARGLTRLQVSGVFSACFVEHNRVEADFVWRQKAAILNEDGLVELYQGKETFADAGGMDGGKAFLTRLLTLDEFDRDDPNVRPKGVLFAGPPGTGKSMLAKCTGNEFELPVLLCNPGNLMGGLVGETESNTRRFFSVCKAMAPCIVIVDEVEKVMPSSRGGDRDGGVGARMLGTFLTQMSDVKEHVFWVFTSNDVTRMHEAFFRAERVDALFYTPLPSARQRSEIWRIYVALFFPAEVNGKAYPRHLETDPDRVLAAYAAQKKPDAAAWGVKLAAALQGLAPEARRRALDGLKAADPATRALHDAAKAALVDDEGWTGAEIRACCRLARRLGESLKDAARRIRPVARTAAKAIRGLEKWAREAALDVETGLPYQAGDEDADEAAPADNGRPPRRISRTVRKTT